MAVTSKTLLMVNHDPPNRLFGELDIADIREVEAFVVGGLEGVFAVYTVEEEPNIYYFASGDDGNWWRISNGLHIFWFVGVQRVINEVIEADKKKRIKT